MIAKKEDTLSFWFFDLGREFYRKQKFHTNAKLLEIKFLITIKHRKRKIFLLLT
jgi:hypothetical protein